MWAHAQAPVRIGIAGGGTDLPAWTSVREGFCLSLAIDRYVHATVIDRPDKQVVASYSHLDRASSATEIANGLVRESALMHGFVDGFEVHTMAQVPSHGTGLGVSSSIAVALTAAFARARRLQRDGFDAKDETDRLTIARGAWIVEIDRLLRPIGRQDHMAAAFGGLKLYRFAGTHAYVERVFSDEDAQWAAQHLALIKLPDGHDARAILSGAKSPSQLEAAISAVPVGIRAIEKRSVNQLGLALRGGQVSKRSIPGAVPHEVAQLVEKVEARAGVFGCKIAGAGGGGHLIVACEREAIPEIEQAIRLPVEPVRPAIEGVRSEGWL